MPEHIQVVTLKCANCGAALQVRSGIDELACGYCGSSQQVLREGGIVSLSLLSDSLSRVSQSADRAAAEMAIKRLTKELQEMQGQRPIILKNSEDSLKKLRGQFNYWIIIFLALPILISVVAGVAFLEQLPKNKSWMDTFAYVGCGIGLLCSISYFIIVRPQLLVKEKEIKQRTMRELSEIDQDIQETEAAIKRNKQIAKS